MTKLVCDQDMCTGCTACISICSKSAIKIEKTIFSYNAVINESKCIECGACHKVCPQNNPIEFLSPITWKQGWANEDKIRKHAASGGYATAIMKSFVENKGVVVSCSFKKGENKFIFVNSKENILSLSGSKYVKSDVEGVFPKIKELLREEKRVLFVGLPCQVAGLKSYIPQNLQSSLFTIDLICHGTPSVRLLDRYLQEHKVNLKDVEEILFRTKLPSEVHSIKFFKPGIQDCYITAFLKCLIFTPNCYSCQYAGIKRGSDLTLGDSWGSELSDKEQSRGISLAICVTRKGEELLDMADIYLADVNVENAVLHNSQLRKPADNKLRERFIDYLNSGSSFDRAMFKLYPKLFIKQKFKSLLIRFGIVKVVPKIQYGLSISLRAKDQRLE